VRTEEYPFERTEMLLGREAMAALASAKVAVFGVGGVGGSCAEALARIGVGAIDLFDNDIVSLSNLNRQVVALHSTIGRYKTDVMAERIKDINPECKVSSNIVFYSPDTAAGIGLSEYDCLIDAIDSVTGKVELIVRAKSAGVNIICSMGAGNKMDPAKFVVTDVYETETDPLAKVMRKELRQRGIKDVKVVWSKEPPRRYAKIPVEGLSGQVPGALGANEHLPAQAQAAGSPVAPASNAFVPPAVGLILAAEAVKYLISEY